MEKSSSAFRTISEVASELDVPKHVLRFWEGKFSQLRPMKRGGGRRYYRPEDVELLRGIRWLLYSDGYTIKGVQRILRDNGVRYVKECYATEPMRADERAAAASRRDIPNLAGEAAKQARRRPSGSPKDTHGLVLPESAFTSDQRVFLASVLGELEECRDILRAAVSQHDRNG